jgi:hypothetical protein
MSITIATRIEISRHAAIRCAERLWHGLDVDQACARLHAMAPHGQLVAELPPWCSGRVKETAELYLQIGEDAVLPLARGEDGGWIAKTCLVRGGMSEQTRERRNQRRASMRQSRAHSRRRLRTAP